MERFHERAHAGAVLAAKLAPLAVGWVEPVVLAIPRGGVPVADVVARRIGADLDVLGVEKIGAPWNPEFAVGAVGEGEALWLDEEMTSRLDPSMLAAAIDAERRELVVKLADVRRIRPRIELSGRTVIVVDDGIATGSTVRAALLALECERPARRVLAVPVGPPETLEELTRAADQVVCPLRPAYFQAVGLWYEHFDQVGQREVLQIFGRRRQERLAGDVE